MPRRGPKILDRPPESIRTVDDIREQFAREGIDPRLLVVPPPLAVDSDVSLQARQEAHGMNFESLIRPGTRAAESKESQLVRSFFEYHGSFVPDLLEAYNNFIRNYSPRHVIQVKGTNIRAVFSNLRFTRPTVVDNGKVMPLYPQAARNLHSLKSHIFCNLIRYQIDPDGKWIQTDEPVKNIEIGSIPVMVRSILCRTYGMTRDELLSVGEDPADPGGYYITRGAEKVIPMMDALRENRIQLMNTGSDFGPECRLTTRANSMKTSIVTQLHEFRGMIVVFYNYYPSLAASNLRALAPKEQLARRLNALQIFRIFGIQDDPQVIVKKYILRFVKPELQKVCEARLQSTVHNLNSQGDYLTFILRRFEDLRNAKDVLPGDDMDDIRKRFIKTLRDCFLSHMASDPDEARLLCYGMMIARYVEYMTGLRKSDDRNNYSSKRLVNSAERIERLLLRATRKLISTVETDIDREARGVQTDIKSIARRVNSKIITEAFDQALSTNVWGVKRDTRPEESVVEPLNRASYSSVLHHLTKITAKTSSNNKDLEVRSVQPSQFLYVCPSDTPERVRIGLVKHRAVGCITSQERSEVFLEAITKRFVAESLHEPGCSLMINGRFIGTVDGQALKNFLLEKRRTGILDFDTLIRYHKEDNVFYLHSDHSRPITPLLIVNPETERLVIEEKNMWGKPFSELMLNGVVEYIDPFEMEEVKLATDYNLLNMSRMVITDLLAEHTRLLQLKADVERGDIPDNSHDIRLMESETASLQEELDRFKEKLEALQAEKDEWRSKDIQPGQTRELDERKRRIDELKNDENETVISVGKLTAELDRKQRKVVSLKSAYTLTVIDSDIATVEARIVKEKRRGRYTHCMMSPEVMFSFAASIIPAAGMQYSVRVSYHCSKGVHAMGIYSGVYPIRMDTVNKVQTWPSRPIFTTQMQDIIGLSDLPQGENALVAIMTKGGWGQEDGLIVSKRAADRGLFSHIIYAMEQITLLKSEGYVESFAAPPSREGKNAQIFAGVGDDGLPIIGAQLVEGSAYGVKVRKTVGDPRPQYVIEKIGFAHQGIVERYIIGVNHDGHTFARIKIAQLSPAIVGSKLVLRVAMKGTITRIAPDEELPYFLAKDGTKIVPDLIVNPHSIPARMSVGLLVELLMGKAAAINGRDVDATSFRKLDVDGAVETLRSKGYNPYGKEQFYDPVTDRPIETLIFAGFAYTSILPAIPGLKIQSRNKGAKRLLTRQPSRGADASQSTGMRIGTQERDALVSHGASELLRERLCTASDEHVDIFCATCGRVALSNINTGEVSCPNCGENTKFGCVRMPFAFHTFTSLLAGGGLGIRFGFENPEQKAAREAAGLPPPVPQYVEDQDEEEESESEAEI